MPQQKTPSRNRTPKKKATPKKGNVIIKTIPKKRVKSPGLRRGGSSSSMSRERGANGKIQVKRRASITFEPAKICDRKTLKRIGKGAQATVDRVRCNNRVLAVKNFKEKKHFDRETEMLMTLSRYPTCNDYFGCFYSGVKEHGMYKMYMELGDATVWNEKTDRSTWNEPLSMSKFKEVALNLLKGLAYMHKHNVVHMDIKPENLLIIQGKVKYVDFGMACNTKTCKNIRGSIRYFPPESLEYDGRGDYKTKGRSLELAWQPGNYPSNWFPKNGGLMLYMKKHDVFGLGVTLHEILHNRGADDLLVNCDDLVFNGVFILPNSSAGFAKMASKNRQPSDEIPSKYKRSGQFSKVYAILDGMMHPNPRQRLSASTALARMQKL